MKRNFLLVIVAMFLLGLLAGCDSGSSSAASDPSGTGTASQKAKSKAADESNK